MLRTIEDILELRRWAEARGARPCRDPETGALGLSIPGEPCAGQEVGWDEFEPTFALSRCVFVYEDAPGARRHFIGGRDAARAYVAREAVGGIYAPP